MVTGTLSSIIASRASNGPIGESSGSGSGQPQGSGGPSGGQNQNGGEGKINKALADFNGYFGFLVGVIENVAGKARAGSNFRLYLPSETGRVFGGNQYVRTVGIGGIAKIVGNASLGAGVLLDAKGVEIYYKQGGKADGAVSPSKMGLNTSVGAYALLVGGVPGFAVGSFYWAVDTFYPDGWSGYVTDYAIKSAAYQQYAGESYMMEKYR